MVRCSSDALGYINPFYVSWSEDGWNGIFACFTILCIFLIIIIIKVLLIVVIFHDYQENISTLNTLYRFCKTYPNDHDDDCGDNNNNDDDDAEAVDDDDDKKTLY